MKNKIILGSCAILFCLCACQQEDDELQPRQEYVQAVKLVKEFRSDSVDSNGKQAYTLYYKGERYPDIWLTDVQASRISRKAELEWKYAAIKGYSSIEPRDGGKTYKQSFRSDDLVAVSCGIPQGVYFVHKIWISQTYQFPTDMVIAKENNDYSTYGKMGWYPTTLIGFGCTVSLSNSTLTLKTAAISIDTDLGGARQGRTYPVKLSNLEWHFKYIIVQE